MLKLVCSCGCYEISVDLSTGDFNNDKELSSRLDDFSDIIDQFIDPKCLPQGTKKGEQWRVFFYTDLENR